MNYDNKDLHWKELADHLRKLNLDYYWRSQDMINQKKAHKVQPQSRPMRRTGMGISMSVRQEYTPPVLTGGDRESDSSQVSENEDQKLDLPERGL